MSNNNEREQKSIESLALRCDAEVFLDAAIQISTREEFSNNPEVNAHSPKCDRCLCPATGNAVLSDAGSGYYNDFIRTYKRLLDVVFGNDADISNSYWWDSSPFDYESRILAALWLYEMVKDVQETAQRGEATPTESATQHD